MSDYPTIALIGPGAIGTTIAAVLHEAGRTPQLCGRTAHAQLRLRHDEGEIVVPGPVLTDPTVIDRPYDLVFIAVKTTQNADSAGWLNALCDENTVVCALQNGVEQKAQLAPWVNGATVLPSVVWFPAQREPDASVWLRASPRLTLPDVPQAKRVADALNGTRCAVDLSADFLTVAWRKLLHDDVAQEILANFQRAPADLGTSILADRQANRPMEWDIRNGVIQRYGRAHGIPVPISDVLVPLLAAGSEGPG